MPALAFVGGISAIGKTTLLAQVPGRDRTWLWWSAGKLIADELGLGTLPTDDPVDVLRYQEALVRGYERRSHATALPVVMDGHFTLPTSATRMAVPAEVFRALAPQVLVVLAAPPDELRQRMVRRDGNAPLTTALAASVVAESEAARAVAYALGLPLHCWPAEPATVDVLTGLIEELRT